MFGQSEIELIIPRIPIETDQEAKSVLEYCKTKRLEEQTVSTCKRIARNRLESEKWTDAILYYTLANDADSISCIAE